MMQMDLKKVYLLPLDHRTILESDLRNLLVKYSENPNSSLIKYLRANMGKSYGVCYSVYAVIKAVTDKESDIEAVLELITHEFRFKKNKVPNVLYLDEYDFIKSSSKPEVMKYLIRRYGLTYDQAENLWQSVKNDDDYNIEIMNAEIDIDDYPVNIVTYTRESLPRNRANSGKSWADMLENVQKIKDAHNNILSDIYKKDYDSSIDIDIDDPIIVFSGDWHIGGRAVDYKSLLDHWKFIYDSDGVYVITVGDLVDMFIEFKNKAVIFSQIVTPTEQLYILKTFLEDMFEAGKIAAVAVSEQSVHDSGVKAVAGIELYNLLFQDYRDNVAFFHNRGIFTVNTPSGSITIAIQHKGSGSRIDPFRGNYNMYRDYYQDALIYVSAHHHTGGYASAVYGSKRRVMINIGAFKKNDVFSLSYFNKTEESTSYGVYLKDGRVRMVSDDIQALYDYREVIRNREGN